MKRTTREGDADVDELKRRRQTSPLKEKGSPEPLREKSTERVSWWLQSLPQSPRSLASPDAVGQPAEPASARSQDPSGSFHSDGSSASLCPDKLVAHQYRVQVLARLNIAVDADADENVRQRLLPTPPAGGLDEERTAAAARELYEGARALLERPTASGDEWTALLSQALHCLMRAVPGRLCCVPNRAWQPSLKPVTLLHHIGPPSPQKRNSAPVVPAQPAQGYPTPDHTNSPAQPHPPPALLANRTEPLPSSVPVLRLEPAPPRLQPKTPRPDLSIGLSDSDAAWKDGEESWTRPSLRGRDVKEILADMQHAAHQESVTLITDPCTASPSGLRFPFLTVEAKSADSATIADAENLAAVSAACALRILGDLSKAENAASKLRTFSLTTEGPVHVLWAHIPQGKGSHMIWLGAYRITHRASAEDLVRKLALILHWGAGDFADWVKRQCVQFIDRILNA
ncbi:hypothetical protein SLS55_005951 [Diplodia seriata]|uniref:Uncharacterized protein n=1 Tax=Diplodia seriata TaxID=420778 RepID=A0ABR3CCW6_9PEZI